jgi:hypothetical protein
VTWSDDFDLSREQREDARRDEPDARELEHARHAREWHQSERQEEGA